MENLLKCSHITLCFKIWTFCLIETDKTLKWRTNIEMKRLLEFNCRSDNGVLAGGDVRLFQCVVHNRAETGLTKLWLITLLWFWNTCGDFFKENRIKKKGKYKQLKELWRFYFYLVEEMKRERSWLTNLEEMDSALLSCQVCSHVKSVCCNHKWTSTNVD